MNFLIWKLILWPSSQYWNKVKTFNCLGENWLWTLATFIQIKGTLSNLKKHCPSYNSSIFVPRNYSKKTQISRPLLKTSYFQAVLKLNALESFSPLGFENYWKGFLSSFFFFSTFFFWGEKIIVVLILWFSKIFNLALGLSGQVDSLSFGSSE